MTPIAFNTRPCNAAPRSPYQPSHPPRKFSTRRLASKYSHYIGGSCTGPIDSIPPPTAAQLSITTQQKANHITTNVHCCHCSGLLHEDNGLRLTSACRPRRTLTRLPAQCTLRRVPTNVRPPFSLSPACPAQCTVFVYVLYWRRTTIPPSTP